MEVANSLYATIEKKAIVLTSSWRNNLVKSTRWFNIYEVSNGEFIVIWKYNHLFKSLEPDILARLYHYYPENLDIYKTDIHARGVFVGGKA